jgi:Mrp family chromosome partitioning ATPase
MSILDSALLKAYARKSGGHAAAADFRKSRIDDLTHDVAGIERMPEPEPDPPEPHLCWAWPEICDALQAAVGSELEAFVNQLLSYRRYQNLQVIAFTGAERGVGRTTFVTSLARAVAADGRGSVLLVDADTGHPHLTGFLTMTGQAGKKPADGELALTDIIPLEPRLNLLAAISSPSENSGTRPGDAGGGATGFRNLPEILEQFSNRLQAERERHDLILLDAGPWDVATVLLRHLPRIVDATVSVARAPRGVTGTGLAAPPCCVKGIEHLGTIETFSGTPVHASVS